MMLKAGKGEDDLPKSMTTKFKEKFHVMINNLSREAGSGISSDVLKLESEGNGKGRIGNVTCHFRGR